MDDVMAKTIAFKAMRIISPAGLKAGRYIYWDIWRNQLIDLAADELEIAVDERTRQQIEKELKQAWQNLLDSRLETTFLD
jgi:hypothetical protein